MSALTDHTHRALDLGLRMTSTGSCPRRLVGLRHVDGTDYLYLPGVGVESTVESHPRFHTDSTPLDDDESAPVHTPAEHDSTPVHTDSTPGFHTCPHPAPAL